MHTNNEQRCLKVGAILEMPAMLTVETLFYIGFAHLKTLKPLMQLLCVFLLQFMSFQ